MSPPVASAVHRGLRQLTVWMQPESLLPGKSIACNLPGIWLKPWAAAWARHMLLPQATKIDCFAAACSCLDFNHRENSPEAHNSLFQAVASTKQSPMWLPGQAKSNGFAGSIFLQANDSGLQPNKPW